MAETFPMEEQTACQFSAPKVKYQG